MPKKKSVQKRVSDASKKKIAKAKSDVQRARRKQSDSKRYKAATEKRVERARLSMTEDVSEVRRAVKAGRAKAKRHDTDIKSGRSEEVRALSEAKKAGRDRLGKAARTGESMKAYAKKKKPAKLRPGTSNPW